MPDRHPEPRIVLCDEDPAVEERILQASGVRPTLRAFADLEDSELPEALVVRLSDDEETRQGQLEHMERLLDLGVRSVALSDTPTEVALAALRAGVVDVLHPDADVAEYRQALLRAVDRATRAPAAPMGSPVPEAQRRVIVILAPKGGVGKTTVATNLALGLAMRAPERTVLVDLDAQFGDVLTSLNMFPEYRLHDMTTAALAGDALGVKTFLARHESGLAVIGASDHPAEADTVSGVAASRLVTLLAESFQYVVVDTAAGVNDLTLAAADAATDLVLVTTLDVIGIRALRREMEVLDQLNLLHLPRHMVVNRDDPRHGITAADFVANIGAEIDVQVPVSKVALLASNQGIPLLSAAPRDPAAVALAKLVERFAPTARTGRQKRRDKKEKQR